jgi:hypothetical protein
MTPAPPIPGTHTIIVDPRLIMVDQPLFYIPEGYTITAATPMRWHPSGMIEFRVVVGVRKQPVKHLDIPQHGTT